MMKINNKKKIKKAISRKLEKTIIEKVWYYTISNLPLLLSADMIGCKIIETIIYNLIYFYFENLNSLFPKIISM